MRGEGENGCNWVDSIAFARFSELDLYQQRKIMDDLLRQSMDDERYPSEDQSRAAFAEHKVSSVSFESADGEILDVRLALGARTGNDAHSVLVQTGENENIVVDLVVQQQMKTVHKQRKKRLDYSSLWNRQYLIPCKLPRSWSLTLSLQIASVSLLLIWMK
ncbi:hypothetical protein O6H91_07G007000 [Diphasiastrum complanatum]|uniref:Uncharacterized protein n=1 Tax=Diphasiastrum complanatum TaxID=34168 RepID=A0ACC2D2L0_DIPCM|nr:hypothetical protein O6H91_07G007000 [Diphasiastrum complanatum]